MITLLFVAGRQQLDEMMVLLETQAIGICMKSCLCLGVQGPSSQFFQGPHTGWSGLFAAHNSSLVAHYSSLPWIFFQPLDGYFLAFIVVTDEQEAGERVV
jgi:hypothetical protein